VIQVEGVSQVFAGGRGESVRALDDVGLDVVAGEFVTLVGRSGCGKSTLLRIVAGLLAPTSGRVLIGGQPVRGPRRDVALVFQRPALMPWRTVLENVLLPVEILGLDRTAGRRRAEQLLELVGLAGAGGRRPWELSGGMQQRVALCRALIQEPAVLLMDEPFAALDAITREELGLELQRIWSETRKTIVFVTHSIEEAVLLADRIALMTSRPGRISRIVNVDLPRPRSLGRGAHAEELHAYAALLHDHLLGREAA
jgi:NitT/TauT family transport system ATP-binding protein